MRLSKRGGRASEGQGEKGEGTLVVSMNHTGEPGTEGYRRRTQVIIHCFLKPDSD